MSAEWTIYKYTNKINGKCYIGQTKQTANARSKKSGLGYKPSNKTQNSIFWNAIQKYGWDNFEYRSLEKNIKTKEEANAREIYWIGFYHSYVGLADCNGYNMTRGGDDRENLGYAVYQISMKDLSIVNEFASTAEASRAISGGEGNASQIRRCCEGEKCSCKGFYWCYKQNYTPKWRPKENQLLSSVLQIDDDLNVLRKYESIQECVALTGFSAGSIVSCCQRRQRKANGYYWCYTSSYNEEWYPPEMSFLRNEPIYCFETNLTYQSSIEASRLTGANRSHILRCCHGLENGANGLHFCYLKDKDRYILNTTQKRGELFTQEENNLLIEKYPRWGICKELLEIFPNRTEGSIRQQAHRLNLKYLGESKHYKKVRCKDNGLIFNSNAEAAAWAGLKDGTSITKCCKGQRKTAGGHEWEYV